jgi:hypothetical protein
MDAKALKLFAGEILNDFEKMLNELNVLSGYMYDHKKLSRLRSVYYMDLSKTVHEKFQKFQKAYEALFNEICKNSLNQMGSNTSKDELLKAKMRFWSNILKSQHPEVIIQRYLDAASSGNEAFMYFIEKELIHSIKNKDYQKKLDELIKKQKKLRISEGTQQELSQLKSLYGFYILSMKFNQNRMVNTSFIQDLFASLNRVFDTPLQELIENM